MSGKVITLFLTVILSANASATPERVHRMYGYVCPGAFCPLVWSPLGSSVCINTVGQDAYFLTCCHQWKDVQKAQIEVNGSKVPLVPVLKWADMNGDGLVLCRARPPTKPYVVPVRTTQVQVGENLSLLGWAGGTQRRVISAVVVRTNPVEIFTNPGKPIPGMSGGPVLDSKGYLVALVSAFINQPPQDGVHLPVTHILPGMTRYFNSLKPSEEPPAPQEQPKTAEKDSEDPPKKDPPQTPAQEPTEPDTKTPDKPTEPETKPKKLGILDGVLNLAGSVPWGDIASLALLLGTGGGATVAGGWAGWKIVKAGIGVFRALKSRKPGTGGSPAEERFPVPERQSEYPQPGRDTSELEQVLSLRQQEVRNPLYDAFFGVALEDEHRSNPDQSIREAWDAARRRFEQVAPLSTKTTEVTKLRTES